MARWIRFYQRRWLRGDLIAGIAVAALIVPKNLGYAGIAEIPVQNDLYAVAVGAILYAVFGTSRFPAVAHRVPGSGRPAPQVDPDRVTVDATTAEVLADLDEALNADGISLVFAELEDPVRRKIERCRLTRTIDPRLFYPTIESAIAAFCDESDAGWPPTRAQPRHVRSSSSVEDDGADRRRCWTACISNNRAAGSAIAGGNVHDH